MPCWPFLRVSVAGASMEPTLHDGQWWVVRRTHRIRPGDVVALESPDHPGMLVVKRAVRHDPQGWWVEGDNPVSRDSRTFGYVPDDAIVGRLILRYAPWPPGR